MPKRPLPPILSRAPARGVWAFVLKDGPAQLALNAPAQKPQVDERAMSVTAVLSTDAPDRQGDIVVPGGVETGEHRVNPVVMFHHGKDHKLPIGKAEDPSGRYTVRLVNGRLVGTTYFAQDDPVAEQVFNLVKQDVLRGISIGFDPVPGQFKAIGEAPDDTSRPPLRFEKSTLLEYSHTPIGVNRDALTLAVRKAVDGSRPLHPLILKALTPFAAPRTVAVRGGWQSRQVKAMDDYDDVPAAPGGVDDPAEVATEEPGAAGPSPTVKAMYDLAQGLLDLADQTEDALSQGEHVKGKKYALKVLEGVRADADACKAMGDKIAAELGSDDAPEADTESDDVPEPAEVGEDGAIVTKGYSPRRWTYADLLRAKPAETVAVSAVPEDDPEELKALEREKAHLLRSRERGRRYVTR